MNNFILDIWALVSSLSFIDYVLYFAVVLLIMLIVSLIYVIQNEKLEETEIVKEEISEGQEMVITKNEELDLKNIVNTIDENPKPLVDMTAYEEEQEQKAIISYDELIRDAKQTEISYDKEEMVDNVIPVKKISLSSNLTTDSFDIIPGEPKIEIEPLPTKEKEIKLFSYEKEEAFLQALQQLNELLN